MLELILILLMVGVGAFVASETMKFNRAIKDLREFEEDEELRGSELIAKKQPDKDKPWPITLVRFMNGIQVGSTNLNALEVRYGPRVIGTYDGWKIYDTVAYNGVDFEYDNVAVKRNGRYLLRGDHQDVFLILAPGLVYKAKT